MPVVRDNKFLTSYVIYDAPINEQTKEIRRKFDVDEKTGYQRRYNWRSLADLGPEYRPDDALKKLLPYREEAMYATYVFSAVCALGVSFGVQCIHNAYRGRELMSKPWVFLASLACSGGLAAFTCFYTPVRQGMINAMHIDYIQKHPDRFETKKRLKLREVLLHNKLCR